MMGNEEIDNANLEQPKKLCAGCLFRSQDSFWNMLIYSLFFLYSFFQTYE